MVVASASTQGPLVSAAAPKPDGPKDLTLYKDYEEALAAMRALRNPSSDEGIQVFDRRVGELAGRLAAGSDSSWALSLYMVWGRELFERFGRSNEALVAFSETEQISLRLGDERSLAISALAQGSVLYSLGRNDQALAKYGLAAPLFERLGDDRRRAIVLGCRGNLLLHHLARYGDALSDYDTATLLFRQLGDDRNCANVMLGRGTVFGQLSRHEEALSDYASSAAIFEQLRDEQGIANVAWGRGNSLTALSRYEEALIEFGKAEMVFSKLRAQLAIAGVLMSRGTALNGLKRYDEALLHFDSASQLHEALGVHDARVGLNRAATLLSLSRYEEVLSYCEKAVNAMRSSGHTDTLAVIAMTRGMAMQSRSQYHEALDLFIQASDLIEIDLQSHIQKLGEPSSASYRHKFSGIVERALKSATLISGLTISQRNATYKVFGTFVGLGMAESIAERGGRPPLALSPKEAGRRDELTHKIREIVARRDQAQAERAAASDHDNVKVAHELQAIVGDLRPLELEMSRIVEHARQRQQVRVVIHYPKAASVGEVQAELDDGVALLEYFVDGGGVFAFATTRSAQQLVALGDSAQLLKDVEDLHASCIAATPPDIETARRLGECLLDPLISGLPDKSSIKTLLIAAHGDLARIPFDPLLVHDSTATTRTNPGVMLIQRYNIAYVHSGTVMRAMRLDARHRTRPTGPEFVGFGFPLDAETEGQADRPETGLKLAERSKRNPLPHTAREVLEIARHFAKEENGSRPIDEMIEALASDKTGSTLRSVHGTRFHLFLREDATEKVLKDDARVRTARILHLGCHGEADLISPSLSRLVLARSGRIEKATGEDGYVYMRELRDLGISAELLVLSACETNAGKLHPLEGITGLSRAGLAAGAESVISTFWRVDDDYARQLMEEFYKRWLAGGMTRIEALSAAKRWAIMAEIPLKTWSAFALWDAKTK